MFSFTACYISVVAIGWKNQPSVNAFLFIWENAKCIEFYPTHCVKTVVCTQPVDRERGDKTFNKLIIYAMITPLNCKTDEFK